MAGENLDWIILKIAQRCNINCSYCYVYHMGDDSWKKRPKIVSNRVIRQTAERIKTHCENNNIYTFNIEFHGGEPLLVGLNRFREIVLILQDELTPKIKLRFHLQTNGLLLDNQWLDFFDSINLSFGISLDGPPDIADKFRVDHKGIGTTKKVVENIQKFQENKSFKNTFSGILCVLTNPTVNSIELIDWFLDNGFRNIDFLLPDGNHSMHPNPSYKLEDYTNFLITAFDYCISFTENAPRIRFFEYMVRGLTGEVLTLDSFGGDLSNICTVESDGSIGLNDVGRICKPLQNEYTDVFKNTLTDHLSHYNVNEIQKLSEQCKKCNFLNACGGGYLPHRFDGESFQNPSYYCETLYNVSEHIYKTVTNEIASIT